jgi:hypothetical protein
MIFPGYFSHSNSNSKQDRRKLAVRRNRLQTLFNENGIVAELDFSMPFIDEPGFRGGDFT